MKKHGQCRKKRLRSGCEGENMFKYVLFGAGKDGRRALREIGKNSVAFFIDNNVNGEIEGIPIYNLKRAVQEIDENILVLVTSYKYKNEMITQLREQGIEEFLLYTHGSGMNTDVKKRLTAQGWAEIYNEDRLDSVMEHLQSDDYSPWTAEMFKLTKVGENILEIGCGSGETSLALAKKGRIMSALDFSESSIKLVEEAVKRFGAGINVQTYCLDATGELPFTDQQFDCVFHAGLLEHFSQSERIDMLKKWKRICRRMVSMVPNADSVPYRMWKERLEREDQWPYGIETPLKTLQEDFLRAGYGGIKEYTIGFEYALNYLPEEHYVRKAFQSMLENGYKVDDWGQGYLLVTIARADVETSI